MKKNLAAVLALVLVFAMLVPVAAFAGANDTYDVSLTIADAENSVAKSVSNITGSTTLKDAIGVQITGARDELKAKFPVMGKGTLFDNIVTMVETNDTTNWENYVSQQTITPAAAADTLKNLSATVDELNAVADSEGKIAIYDGGDYTITLKFTLTTPYVDPTPSGGSSSDTGTGGNTTTYEDEVVTPENGTVEITTEDAVVGDLVTIDAEPAEGYQIARYIVTDEQGNKVEVDAKDGTFVQPAGNVKVEVVFAPIGEEIVIESVQPSPQTLTVDGDQQDAHAYNINGENFVQLRDLAAILSDTDAKFNVTYDAAQNMVVITTGEAYPGTISSDFTDKSETAVPSPQSIMIDGRIVELSAVNIGGNNFFKLRDLAPFFGLKVNYDEPTNTAQVLSK